MSKVNLFELIRTQENEEEALDLAILALSLKYLDVLSINEESLIFNYSNADLDECYTSEGVDLLMENFIQSYNINFNKFILKILSPSLELPSKNLPDIISSLLDRRGNRYQKGVHTLESIPVELSNLIQSQLLGKEVDLKSDYISDTRQLKNFEHIHFIKDNEWEVLFQKVIAKIFAPDLKISHSVNIGKDSNFKLASKNLVHLPNVIPKRIGTAFSTYLPDRLYMQIMWAYAVDGIPQSFESHPYRGVGLLWIPNHMAEPQYNSDIFFKHIKTIIQLPQGLFKTHNLAPCLYILDSQKNINDPVKLIDASDCFEKSKGNTILKTDEVLSLLKKSESDQVMIVDKQTIIKNEGSLFPGHYIYNIKNKPEARNWVRLDELLTIKNIRAKGNPYGLLITPSDIPSDLAFEPITNYDIERQRFSNRYYHVHEGDLILNLSGKVKGTIFSGPSDVYVQSGALNCFEINRDRLDPSFLLMQLYSDDFKSQLKRFPVSTIPRVSHKEFLSLYIPLPSLEDQRREVKTTQQELLKAHSKELGLEKVIHKELERYKGNVRSQRHTILQHVGNIRDGIESLYDYMEMNNGELKLSDLVFKSRNIDAKQLFDSFQNQFDLIVSRMKLLTREYQFGKAKKLFLEQVLQNWKTKYQLPENVKLDINFPLDTPLYIQFNEADLERILNDIVENAIRHGLIEGQLLIIEMEGWADSESDVFLSIKNNGKPFEKGIASKYHWVGEKAGANANTGEGGSIIYETMRAFNGELSVIDSPKEEFPVEIKLNFKEAE